MATGSTTLLCFSLLVGMSLAGGIYKITRVSDLELNDKLMRMDTEAKIITDSRIITIEGFCNTCSFWVDMLNHVNCTEKVCENFKIHLDNFIGRVLSMTLIFSNTDTYGLSYTGKLTAGNDWLVYQKVESEKAIHCSCKK